jgi:flagellum-specific peptidoglycan hydrolase FlgJ
MKIKLIKKGKLWAAAAVALVSLGLSLVSSVNASANETPNATVAKKSFNYDDISVNYQAGIENFGSQKTVFDNGIAGIIDQAKRIETLKIDLNSLDIPQGLTGGISYQAHVSKFGWQDEVSTGAEVGTKGEFIEALKIHLTGDISKYYDVQYQVYVQGMGWTNPSKNGEISGTTGQSKQIEAVKISIIKKASNKIVSTDMSQYPAYINQTNRKDGVYTSPYRTSLDSIDANVDGEKYNFNEVTVLQTSKLNNGNSYSQVKTTDGKTFWIDSKAVVARTTIKEIIPMDYDALIVSKDENQGLYNQPFNTGDGSVAKVNETKNLENESTHVFEEAKLENGEIYSHIQTGDQRLWIKKENLRENPIIKSIPVGISEEEFIDLIAPVAINTANQYGLYPSLLIAQALIESQYGQSGLTQMANNMFGIKGSFNGQSITLSTREVDEEGNDYFVDAPFSAYSTINDSIKDYAIKLREGLTDLPNNYSGTWRENALTVEIAANGLIDAPYSYATDPEYVETIINTINKFDLKTYDSK